MNVSGVEIAYRDNGRQAPAIVLVHGNSASVGVWDPLLASPLAERWRLVALDLPGCGESSPLPDYTFPALAAAISGFAGRTACEDGIFAGHSLGGHLLLEAVPLLRRARGFAIWGAPPIGRPPAMAEAFLPTPAPGFGVTAELTDDDIASWVGVMFAPGSSIPPGAATDIRRADPRLRSGIGAGVGSLAYADEAAAVKSLDRPLAVLHGELDAMVSLAYLEGLEMTTLWRGRVQVIPGAGHYPQLECPSAFSGLLNDFATDVLG